MINEFDKCVRDMIHDFLRTTVKTQRCYIEEHDTEEFLCVLCIFSERTGSFVYSVFLFDSTGSSQIVSTGFSQIFLDLTTIYYSI